MVLIVSFLNKNLRRGERKPKSSSGTLWVVDDTLINEFLLLDLN